MQRLQTPVNLMTTLLAYCVAT
ncbi:MAG: hypothetical protein RJA70_4732, partial [Pseudomonadota bacterium]